MLAQELAQPLLSQPCCCCRCLGDPSCRCVPWLDHLCTSLLTQLPRDPPLACASCQKLHMYQPPVCEHTCSECAEWHVSECLSQRMLCVRNCVTGCTCDVSHVTWQPSSGEKSYRQVSRKPFAEGFPAASWELPTGSPGPWKEPSKGHSPATGPRPSGNLLNENSQHYVCLPLPPTVRPDIPHLHPTANLHVGPCRPSSRSWKDPCPGTPPRMVERTWASGALKSMWVWQGGGTLGEWLSLSSLGLDKVPAGLLWGRCCHFSAQCFLNYQSFQLRNCRYCWSWGPQVC